MLRVLATAAQGMQVASQALDVYANDVANTNTPGFLASRPRTESLLYGRGTSVPSVVGNLDQAAGAVLVPALETAPAGVVPTGNPEDAAVQGQGFFVVQGPGGRVGYTRAGTFGLDGLGRVVTPAGWVLLDASGRPLALPAGADAFRFTRHGQVLARVRGSWRPAGTVRLAVFPNAEGLASVGDGVYQPTPASGTPTLAQPGIGGPGALAGTLWPGYVTASTGSLARELVGVLTVERAYQLSARMAGVADSMLRALSQLA